ncbi:Cof-type HAD-IIB family hydrolase [Lactococcus hircilactis]|uniref:Cof-type HAD-IIB family hydrolase n=1 Tax=Lactococcus hircilactis TaxID=1494462 RepID=A0A7X2D208_9LACT|nr:Cof-type HAD-IIB family hydrolase [Lactococcus hircilactis]MQW39982.1 Cof-type HAD-IIB family hydrolase [Lactococcus hircilactis]
MKTKAVFFDLDGTLFTSTRGVAASTKKTIEALKRIGILVGIATGRGPAFVLPLLEDLKLDFAVTYNGQYVFTPKAVIFENPIREETLKKIVTYALEYHRDISIGTSKGVVGSGLLKFGETRTAGILAKILPKGTSDVAKSGMKHIFRRVFPQANFSEIFKEPVYQVMMIAPRADTPTLEKEFPELQITRSNPYSVDLIPQGIGKLKGIQILGEHYDFTLEEVMCFGDSENDISMIQGVGTGVAMGNAQESVKKAANYVTDHNNADGIAKAFDYFGIVEFTNGKDFVSKDPNFNQVKAFHQLMDGKTQQIPRAFTPMEAGFRAGFEVEEIVEFLQASSNGDDARFHELVEQLHRDVDKATQKIDAKPDKETDALTAQADAMIDLLYLTYGSLVLSGIDPYEIFNRVHEANMGKIFPDGSPHFDPVTHKVLKPSDWEKKFAPEGKIKKELERQKRVAERKMR